MTSRSHFQHSDRDPNSTAHLKPRISSMILPSYRDCMQKVYTLLNFLSSPMKKHFHGFSLLASVQAELGPPSPFSTSLFSIIIRFSMADQLVLWLGKLKQRPASRSRRTRVEVNVWSVGAHCMAARAPLQDPAITTSSLLDRQPLSFKYLNVSTVLTLPLKKSLAFLQEMGSRFPMQAPPSQLRTQTLVQLANSPPSNWLSIPPKNVMLSSHELDEPKSFRFSSAMNLQHSSVEVLKSCFTHHPKGVSWKQISTLLGCGSSSSGRQMQKAAWEPSRHAAPDLMGSSTMLQKDIEWAWNARRNSQTGRATIHRNIQ